MKCGKCGSTAIVRDMRHTEEDGTVEDLKCINCGNTSDSKKYGFIAEEKEMSVKKTGKCRNCEREDMALNMGLCGSCSGAWYRTGVAGLQEAKEKFYGKPKGEACNTGKRSKEKPPEVQRAEPQEKEVNSLSIKNLIAAIEDLYKTKTDAMQGRRSLIVESLKRDFGA